FLATGVYPPWSTTGGITVFPNDTNWHHLAWTRRDAVGPGDGKIYFDGVPLYSIVDNFGPANAAGLFFRLGFGMPGRISDVRFYSSFLADADIAALTANTSILVPDNRWTMADGAGTTALDAIGGKHGVFVCGPAPSTVTGMLGLGAKVEDGKVIDPGTGMPVIAINGLTGAVEIEV